MRGPQLRVDLGAGEGVRRPVPRAEKQEDCGAERAAHGGLQLWKGARLLSASQNSSTRGGARELHPKVHVRAAVQKGL